MNKECDIFNEQSNCYNLMNCECKYKMKTKIKLPSFPNEYIKIQYEFMINMYKAYLEALNDLDLREHRPNIYKSQVSYYWYSYLLAKKEYNEHII